MASPDAPAAGQPPGGSLFEIASGDQRAVITESGATLRVYEVGGRPVVEPFDGAEAPVVGAQGEILAPWPNRVVDGRWRWDGAEQQLWLTEPSRGHAIHGLVRRLRWTPFEQQAHRIGLETTVLAHPGWPFPLHLESTYALSTAGLSCGVVATNIGRTACPYGVAAHPYVAIPGGTVDDAVVRIAAATWLATDERLAPTERRPTAGSPYDFDGVVPVGSRQADNAFTDLARLGDGRVEATVSAPDGRTTVVWGDAGVRWWQLFTGDALPERWRRRALALEPMTCGPDALNSGEDLIVLEPGERHSLTWGLALR
jgi:aldose 1-epimerase